jgi:hypothetical protein
MKKSSTFCTVILFASTLFLNISINAKGKFMLFSTAIAKSGEDKKGPKIQECKDKNNNVYAYVTDCTGSGDPCTDTDCPPLTE